MLYLYLQNLTFVAKYYIFKQRSFFGGSAKEEEKIFEKRWQLASTEQKERYNNLISSYPTIDWTFKEKKYLLWLCQLDIDTFETFKVILSKVKQNNNKRANL